MALNINFKMCRTIPAKTKSSVRNNLTIAYHNITWAMKVEHVLKLDVWMCQCIQYETKYLWCAKKK